MGPPVTDVDEAVAAIGRGGLVVLPTETVYGLAAHPERADAVGRIYALKGRPREKVLQVLAPDASWLARIGEPSDAALRIAERFWPGSLTLIVRASPDAPVSVAGDGSVGLRIPSHAVALELLQRTGPLAATSANRSGEPTPAVIDAIRGVFGEEVDVYLDAGYIAGVPSTVLDLSGPDPIIRREGAIASGAIERVLGRSI